jgi:hypothetical protein
VVVADVVRLGYIFLRDPLCVMGWKYAADCTKGIDWFSHQLGDYPCIASVETALYYVLDKLYEER